MGQNITQAKRDQTMDETIKADVKDIEKVNAPWGKELLVQSLSFESGMRMARLRIREGRRFTVVDLDDATIAWLERTLRRAVAGEDHTQPTAD